MNPETPITDALWAHLSQHGWGREHLPCSTIMGSHEKLEREFAAGVRGAELIARMLSDERALADRLAKSIDRLSPWLGESSVIAQALAAWKEARRGND